MTEVLVLPPNTRAATPAENKAHQVESQVHLRAIDIVTFLNTDLKPRERLLSPWLLTQSLSMVYAWRGVGKTHVALGIAYAVASGGSFLTW
jgi:hypothetical protein